MEHNLLKRQKENNKYTYTCITLHVFSSHQIWILNYELKKQISLIR